ncbi:MAG: ATP-binding cassette domain-containing protein [bacterium]
MKNINLEIPQGEYFVFLGHTGSGKTTLLKCLLGLNKIKSGKIFLDCNEITTLPPEKRHIGFLPQNCMLFQNMNVYENIAYGLKLRKYSPGYIKNEIQKITDILDIGSLLKLTVKNLSGGESQRVALARAIVTSPRLFLLDEPFSAIDQGLKNELWFEIKKILKKMKIPVIHITHNLDEGYALGDRLGIISDGLILQTGKPAEVFSFPANEEVAKLLGIKNIFSGVVIASDEGNITIDLCGMKIKSYGEPQKKNLNVGEKVRFCVMPDSIKLVKEDIPLREEISENVFDAVITSSYFFSDTSIMKLKIIYKNRSDNGEHIPEFLMKVPIQVYKRYELSDGLKIKIAFWKQGILLF